MTDLRFLSSNRHKIAEVVAILGPIGFNIHPVQTKIHELQTTNFDELVRDKLLRAFAKVGRPIFVEHSGLQLKGLADLPGGLTQIFWDALNADAFASLVRSLSTRAVVAQTVIGYCDSQKIYYFKGEVNGTVPEEPRGPRDFQWDCVFIPDGYSQTFAEMGPAKNDVSMRRAALVSFADFLVTHR